MSARFALMVLLAVSALCLVFLGAASHGLDKQPNASMQEVPQIPQEDWQAIKRSAEEYAKAFNAGEAESVAKLYALHAELVDVNNNTYRGRATIEQAFAAYFSSYPNASIQIEVDEVHFPTTNLAIERGRTVTRTDASQTAIYTEYAAVHVKDEQGKWLLAQVQDKEIEADFGAKLEKLSWLIGRWIDEDEESLLEIDCYWHPSGTYLIRDFKVRVEGLVAATGTERIGWDPLRQQVRSWLFDSEGGYLEAIWLPNGDKWHITAHGYRADGRPTEATYTVSRLKQDAYHLASFNRFAGEEQLDDLEMTIVKRPPEPLQNQKATPPRTQ